MDNRKEFEELVTANRILANQGVVDVFGHISVRHPQNPERFVMSRSRAPELVEFDDLMEFELEGDPIDGQGRTPYGERFIHGAILEARPEINAVIHNHSYEVLPFGLTGTPLRPVLHTASVCGPNIPVWDIRDNFGDNTDLLVRNMEQGRNLSHCLANNSCALMRGHGAVIAGRNIKEAVITSIYLKINAQIQTTAMEMGDPVYLSDGEIKSAADLHCSPLAMDRMWEAFCLRVGR